MSRPVIGICTDSNSQLCPTLAERYRVEIVPLTVIVDEYEYLEGVDLGPDSFYDLYTGGHRPEVTFTVPSSGQFAAAYDDLIDRGCTQILSIHTAQGVGGLAVNGQGVSGTMAAARLAARMAPVPVRVVDSTTSRFGVSCCVWAAGDAIARGASLDEAAGIAESLAPSIGNVFIATGHRADQHLGPHARRAVMTLEDGTASVLEHVDTLAAAVNAMARHTLAWGAPLHVAVGSAHRCSQPVADALARSIGESANVVEVVQFRFGASVGAEAGPGTVGCVMYPVAPL